MMQQTRLDRWLQKKFVHRTFFYTNTLPRSLPPGTETSEADPHSGGQYAYQFEAKCDEDIHRLTEIFKRENITFASRVGDREGFPAKLFSTNHSFTITVLWILLVTAFLLLVFSGLPELVWRELSSPESKP
ncbi:hypothetical protein N9406_03585 [Verrucomicrobiales bacterium]|jgi:hypothetical protein|nr:hypothetical protein [Verrucomicrobiales bacterium]MDB3940020.1 hypothetical protein [Verrucomicrobiales bacterium]